MQKSGWEYIKTHQPEDISLPDGWSVVRIHGTFFSKLASEHKWKQPMEERCLKLLTRVAKSVMLQFMDIIMAYGHDNEYSFVFRRETEIFDRWAVKIVAAIVSKFSSAFSFFWRDFFPEVELPFPPIFDCSMLSFQTDQNLKDYFTWRQAECHYQSLYNIASFNLLDEGVSQIDVEKELAGATMRVLENILLSRFSITECNNNVPESLSHGTVLVLPPATNGFLSGKGKNGGKENGLEKFIELTCSFMEEEFWQKHPHVLNTTPLKMLSNSDQELKKDYPDLGLLQKIPQRCRSNSVNLPVKFSYDDARNVGIQLGRIADDYKQSTSPERRSSLQNNRLI